MAIKTGIVLCTLLLGCLAVPVPKEDVDMSVFFENSMARDAQGRIVGGTVAAVGAHPWMVAFTIGTTTRTMNCGASIISQRTVLTAAHCLLFVRFRLRTVRLIVGTNRYAVGGVSHPVSSVAIHPQWSLRTLQNDIATMFTTNTIVYTQLVRPIGLAFDHFDNRVQSRMAGWGLTTQDAEGMPSDVLLELTTSTIPIQQCIADAARAAVEHDVPAAPPVHPATMLCSFHSAGHGNCRGDSGSALVRLDRRQQIGVVSWGFPCALGGPDMYARVSAYQTWITQNTRH